MKASHGLVALGIVCILGGGGLAAAQQPQQPAPWQQQNYATATTVALEQQATATAQQATTTAQQGQKQNGAKQTNNPPPPTGSIGAEYFAPYADMSLYGAPSLQTIMQSTGQKQYTLAFITGNSCSAEWAGSVPLNQTSTYLPHLDSDIQAIRAQGGDVTISFGGQAGQELAQTCSSANSLQAQYQAVIDQYSARHIDFDIEGGEEGDAKAYDLRNTALAALQTANPGLTISFTLPAATTGLLSTSLGLLNNAISHGVNFQIVNLMTMDFGPAPVNGDMGQGSIDAANAFYSQLQSIFPSRSSSQLWSMVGITPLIGQNDTQGEIFTLDDAKKVLSFAQQNKIGELAFWAVARDNGSCAGQATSSPKCSGIAQNDYDFINIFKEF